MLNEYPYNGVIRKLVSRDLRSNMHRQRMSHSLISVPQIQNLFELDPDLSAVAKASFVSFVPVSKPDSWTHDRDKPGERSAHARLQYFLSHA